MPDTTPPRWIALSWQLRESTPVTDGLSIARIVQAGIEIADEHGLGGLSLRKLVNTSERARWPPTGTCGPRRS